MYRFILLLAIALTAPSAWAQSSPDLMEIGGVSYGYDTAIADWRGAVIKTRLDRGPRAVFLGEAVAEQRYDEPSFAYKLQHSADFGRWITRLAARTSSGGFYNPRYRVDASIGRKVLPGGRLILMVGAFYRDGRDGHQDAAAIAESQLYLTRWLIAQASVRFQQSNPGGAMSRYHDVALTLGRPGKVTLLLHAAAGTEAYQIIDPLVIFTDFESRQARVGYRQWITRGFGASVTGSWYSNPYYTRTGMEVSFFFGFGGRRR